MRGNSRAEIPLGRSAVMARILVVAAGVCLCCMSVSPRLRAQVVSSSIVGTVVDSTGAAVPGAHVTLTNVGTRVVRTATTSMTGIFRFPTLLPGAYTVDVTANGFKKFTTENIELVASSTRDLGKLTLSVGAVTQTVTVTAAVTPIQTSSSAVSHSVTGSALAALPLKGRDLFGAIDLVPGVVDTNLNRSVTSPNALGGLSLNGSYSGDSPNINFTVDGITSVDVGSDSTVHSEPNMGAIQELRVLSDNYTAQYGRTSGGTIEVITKSGTSQYHGQGWWDHRHEQFNANDYFNNKSGLPRALYRYNIEGWAFGGPVPIPRYNSSHNKLFFFASQEYTGQLAINRARYVTFPNDDLRGTSAADAACNCVLLTQPTSATGTISDHLVNPPGSPLQQYSAYGGTYWGIPNSKVNSVGEAMLNYFPEPLFNAADCAVGAYECNYASDVSNTHGRRNDVIRIDWDPTSKLTSYFRWIHDYDDENPTQYTLTGWPALPFDHPNPGHGYVGSFTYIFSPTLLNEITVGYDWNSWAWYLLPGDLAAMAPSNIGNPPLLLPIPTSPQGVNGYNNIMPAFSFGSDLPNMPSYSGTSRLINFFNENPTWTVEDNLTKVHKTHEFKMGVYIEHNFKVAPGAAPGGYEGAYNFTVDSTNPLNSGDGFVNALLGNYDSFTQLSSRGVFNIVYWNIEPYVQDSWRATKRLTLDYGVRLYVHTPQADAHGTISYFDPAQYDPANAPRIYVPACAGAERPCSQADLRSADPASLSVLEPAAYIGAFVPGSGNPANGMVIPQPLQATYKRDFPFAAAPRVGFAYDVFGNAKTAVRGGFGVFYSRMDTNQINPASGQLPYSYTYSASAGTISSLATTTGVITPASIFSHSGLVPWSRNYNGSLNVQQALGFNTSLSVAGVFNLGRDLNVRDNINPVPLGANFEPGNISPITGKALTQVGSSLERTVYPGFQDITAEQWLGYTNYYALEVTLEHRLSKGLLFGASYTWAKELGVTSFDPLVADNNARNYGPLSYDRRQNLQINYSYDLPGLSTNLRSSALGKVAGAIVDNWTFSGLTSLQSGAPLQIGLSAPGQDITGSASETPRPDVVCNPAANVPSGFMFNPACFALPGNFKNVGVASIGNEGIYPVYSKGLDNWNMILSKFVPIGLGESRGFQLQVQAYNVFNHPQFDPGTGGSSTTARFNSSGTLTDATALGKPASDATGPRVLAFALKFTF